MSGNLRATLGTPVAAEFNLSFQDIMGRKKKKGMYQHRNGKILVVCSNAPQLVNHNTRTGRTRTGMFVIDVPNGGGVRVVVADNRTDVAKNWKEYAGTATIQGNPHLVAADPAGSVAVEGQGEVEDFEDGEIDG